MVHYRTLIPTQTKVQYVLSYTLLRSERASASLPSWDSGLLAANSTPFLHQMASLSLVAEFSALSIGSVAASFLNCSMKSPVV